MEVFESARLKDGMKRRVSSLLYLSDMCFYVCMVVCVYVCVNECVPFLCRCFFSTLKNFVALSLVIAFVG